MVLAGCGRIGFSPLFGEPGTDAGIGADVLTVDPGDVDYPDFQTCPSSLSIVEVGSSQCTGGVLRVTPQQANAIGAVWIATPYNLTAATSFSIRVVLEIDSTGSSGDGMAIVIQNDPRGTAALGLQGGGLGYESITPSVAVEVDTFRNSEPAAPHLGIDFDGTVDTALVSQTPFSLTTGNPFTVWLDYDGAQNVVHGYAANGQGATKPTMPTISAADDLTRLGSSAWLGITAACGSSAQAQHKVLAWRVDVTP
jgi:hypothetical protein